MTREEAEEILLNHSGDIDFESLATLVIFVLLRSHQA
jgi:hypothetical protein